MGSKIGLDSESAQRHSSYLSGSTTSGRQAFKNTLDSWVAAGLPNDFPVTPHQVRNFVRAQAIAGRSGKPLTPRSIRLMLRQLSHLHVHVLQVDDPTKHILVTSEMKALFRERGSRGTAITPLRLKGDVADIIQDEPLPGSILAMLRALEGDYSPWALRTRVVLGLGADTGRNRSEYVELNIGNIAAMPDSSGTAAFKSARSDRDISEAPKYLSPETMGFIQEWLGWREKAAPGSTGGEAALLVRINQKGQPGGRLTADGYVDVLQDIMRRLGGGAHVSGNSFKAGLKLDLAAIGTAKVGIANALGLKEIA